MFDIYINRAYKDIMERINNFTLNADPQSSSGNCQIIVQFGGSEDAGVFQDNSCDYSSFIGFDVRQHGFREEEDLERLSRLICIALDDAGIGFAVDSFDCEGDSCRMLSIAESNKILRNII